MMTDRIAHTAARIATAGRTAWPSVALADDQVAARLSERVSADPDADLDELHDADLYLAIALSAGDAAAMREFEQTLVPQIDIALRHMRLASGVADEVKQVLRFELLVGDGAPKIADYAGRGELGAWLRISATRKALKLIRKTECEETLDEILLEQWPAGTPDPRHKHMRSQYTAELKRAIGEAFLALEVRQRNLMRQHVLDELTIDDLARLYRVHRATCARWLAEARAELSRGTRKRLVRALGVNAEELDSVLRFLDSDIELSISRILLSA